MTLRSGLWVDSKLIQKVRQNLMGRMPLYLLKIMLKPYYTSRNLGYVYQPKKPNPDQTNTTTNTLASSSKKLCN